MTHPCAPPGAWWAAPVGPVPPAPSGRTTAARRALGLGLALALVVIGLSCVFLAVLVVTPTGCTGGPRDSSYCRTTWLSGVVLLTTAVGFAVATLLAGGSVWVRTTRTAVALQVSALGAVGVTVLVLVLLHVVTSRA